MNEQHKQTCREALQGRRGELLDLTTYEILDDNAKQKLVDILLAIDAALAALGEPEWMPLEDGTVTETTYGERVEIMTGSLINIIDGEDDCHGYELPPDIRLCRRTPKESQP